MNKKLMSYAVTAAMVMASLAMAMPASAAQPAAPGQNKLTCAADVPATCTLDKTGRTATIDTTTGGAASVYLAGYNSSFYGVRVAQVTKLSNTYTGTAGVDPRWSIPIDDTTLAIDVDSNGTVGPGYTDYFLFVSFSTCNDGAGLVDVINDPTCTIYDSRDASVSYPNWLAYVTANTNATIAALDYFAFIIADSSTGAANHWTVSNVTVGKPGK